MNRVWMITGAGRGLGHAFAEEAVKNGEKVIATVRKINDTDPLMKNENVLPVIMDVTKKEEVAAAVDAGIKKFGRIDVLINNAGVYHDKDILDDSEAFTGLIMNLHMYTPAMLCYLFGQEMKARRKGYILNVCSVTSKMAAQRLGTYGSTKAFLSA